MLSHDRLIMCSGAPAAHDVKVPTILCQLSMANPGLVQITHRTETNVRRHAVNPMKQGFGPVRLKYKTITERGWRKFPFCCSAANLATKAVSGETTTTIRFVDLGEQPPVMS